MTSSFPEQQYNPQALSGGFNPIEQVDLAPAIQAEQERQMAPERARLQELAANDKVRIQNAGQYGRDLQALGQLSETLSNQLLEYQKKENEKAMQRGMMNAYTEGVPLNEQEEFDQKEAQLEATKVAAEKDAADAEANGASVFTGEKIRQLSGWEKYGYVKGRMQIHAQGFPLFIAQNSDRQFTIGGETFTLNSAKKPEQQAAALQGLLAEYVDPYKEYSPVMASKYLFKPLQGIMQQQMVLFAQQRGKEIKAERKAERANDFVKGLELLEPDANVADWLQEEVKKHPLGLRAGRTEYYEVLKNGIEQGTISLDQAERFVSDGTSFNGGKRESWVNKFPNDFGGLTKLIEEQRISQNTRENQLDAVEKDRFVKDLRAKSLADDGQYSQDEKDKDIEKWKSTYPGQPVPSELSGLYSTSDAMKDAQRQRLRAIADANGGVIAPQYAIGIHPDIRKEFDEQIGAGVAVDSISRTQQTQVDNFLSGVNNELNLYTTGTTSFKDTDSAIQAMNVRKRFDSLLNQNIKKHDPETAIAETIKEMKLEIAPIVNGTVPNPYKTVTGADEAAYWNRQKAQKYVAGKDMLVEADKGLILGIEPANLETAHVYLTTGKGELPYIFKYLARRDPRISAIELAAKQLQVAGYKGFKIPEAERKITESDNIPARNLLRQNNTPSRTYRAAIEDPELVNVLDQIAGVESESSGGYDAYNEGGYSADAPYGSGDSSDSQKFGKPISQMTIGELMKWQAKPKNQLGIHAAGRYQFIGNTLKEVVQQMGITKDMVFNPALQDAMALHRLRWRLNLQNSTTGLINEWAGLKRLKPAQLKQLLEDAQDVYDDPYNSPENLLKGLS